MRLRSEARKNVDPSTPPPPEPLAPSSRTRASSRPRTKASAKALVEDPANALAEVLVEHPERSLKGSLRPLAMALPKALAEASTTSSLVYHSAYSGSFVTNSDGSFHCFVFMPDQSHALFGYWRFGSDDDERHAHIRGFSKPEDVLVAQDRSDGSYDDISMHWVWGSRDPNLGTPLYGSAADHLKTIYEIRRVLGKPMSLRGHIPIYPLSHDDRVKFYLAKKFSVEETAKLSCLLSSDREVPQIEDPELSLSIQPGGEQDKFGTVLSETRFLDNGSRSSQNMGAAPASHCTASLQLRTVSPLAHPRTQDTGDAMPMIGSEPLPSQAARSKTKHTTIHSKSRYSVPQPNPMHFSPTASPSEVVTSKSLQIQSNPSFGSFHQNTSSSSRATTNGSEHVSPYSLLQENSTQPLAYAISTPHTPPSDSRSSSPAKPSLLSHYLLHNQPQLSDPTRNARETPEHSPVELASPLQQHTYYDTPEDSKSATDQHVRTVSITSQTYVNSYSLRDQTCLEERRHSEIGHDDIQSDEDVPQYVAHVETEQLSGPAQTNTEVRHWFEDVPCMDCGLNDGHKQNCYIGNLKPMNNLTVLDHRSLADAVERFDPVPWTTHFDQYPQQKPEDPAVQMQGMAELIRNEDSYKSDPELQELPDNAMILLWAFKTAPGVEVMEG